MTLLSKCTTGREILKLCLDKYLSKNKSLSIGSFCRDLEIKSKGHISEVLSGKKNLSKKYHFKISTSFFESIHEKEFALAIFEREQLTNELEIAHCDEKISYLKKSLGVEKLPGSFPRLYEASFILARLGLYRGHPVEVNQLHADCVDIAKDVFDAALEYLCSNNILELNEEGLVTIRTQQAMVEGHSSDMQCFLTRGFIEALKAIEERNTNPDISFFQTDLVSVSPEQLPKLLVKIRATLDQFLSHAESPIGDKVYQLSCGFFETATSIELNRHRSQRRTDSKQTLSANA